MSSEGVGTRDLTSLISSCTWPRALNFFKTRDVRLWTISPTVDYTRGGVSTFTVLNYDGDPFTSPHTFTILLPRAHSLQGGRLFFIYVDNYISGDLLALQTYPGTTDTVNGSLFGKTLTLTGAKKHLFMCVCIGGENYLIQPFGDPDALNPYQYGYNAIPTRVWNGRLTPVNTSFSNTGIAIETGTTAAFMNVNTIVGHLDIIPGLTNAFSYVAIPTQVGIYGFLCNEGGWYRFTVNTRLLGTGASPNLGYCALVTFTNTGAILRSGAAANQVVISSSVKNPNMNVAGSVMQHFVAGYYYSFGITGNYTALELLGDGGASDPVQNLHTYTFTLIKKDVVTNFALAKTAGAIGGEEEKEEENLLSVMIGDPRLKTTNDKKKFLKDVTEKRQKREREMVRKLEMKEEEERRKRQTSKKRKKMSVDDDDSEFGVRSELSLADVEGIVKRMLSQNQCELPALPPPPPPPPPTPSHDSTTTKKRKRLMVGGVSLECGEKEIL